MQTTPTNSRTVMTALLLLALCGATPAAVYAQRTKVVAKQCDSCRRAVPLSSRVGGRCPHCKVTWTIGREEYLPGSQRFAPQRPARTAPQPPSSRPSEAPSRPPSSLQTEPARRAETPRDGVSSPGGRYTVSRAVRRAGAIAVFDLRTEETLHFEHSGPLMAEMFSTDDRFLVCLESTGRCTVYELATGAPLYHPCQKGAIGTCFVPDEHVTVVVKSDVIYFRTPAGLAHGRISAGRGNISEAVLRYGEGRPPHLFVNTNNARSGIYALGGNKLTAGQRLPPAADADSPTPATGRSLVAR